MTSPSVIPTGTELYRSLAAAAEACRCLVFAGLPGIGKSLLTLQTALIAKNAGRDVWLLQWDVVRVPFEAEPFKTRYPEHEGVANPVVRIAVDRWLRIGLARWLTEAHPDAILLIEAPLIGGRLNALTRHVPDAVEDLLASSAALFLLPVPTSEVKEALRLKRHASKSADPTQRDARVDVLDAHVEEINEAAIDLGIAEPGTRGYDPAVYAGVYLNAMRLRRCQRLEIDQVFDVATLPPPPAMHRLDATAEEVADAFALAGSLAASQRDRELAEWYR